MRSGLDMRAGAGAGTQRRQARARQHAVTRGGASRGPRSPRARGGRRRRTCAVTTRGPLRPSICTTALDADRANRDTSPGRGEGKRGGAARAEAAVELGRQCGAEAGRCKGPGRPRRAPLAASAGRTAPRGRRRPRFPAPPTPPRAARRAPRTRHDAAHVVAHVRKVQVGVCYCKVDVKLRDLLPQQQQVHDRKQLAVERPRRARHDCRRALRNPRLRAGRAEAGWEGGFAVEAGRRAAGAAGRQAGSQAGGSPPPLGVSPARCLCTPPPPRARGPRTSWRAGSGRAWTAAAASSARGRTTGPGDPRPARVRDDMAIGE